MNFIDRIVKKINIIINSIFPIILFNKVIIINEASVPNVPGAHLI